MRSSEAKGKLAIAKQQPEAIDYNQNWIGILDHQSDRHLPLNKIFF